MTTTENTPEEYRWTLTAEALELTNAKVAKINDRAAKRGWTGRLAVDAKRVEQTSVNDAGIEVTEVVYETRITGDAPKYDGWTFLAVLDWHSAGGELITRCAPGVVLEGTIDRSSLRPGACDHCGTTRDRKDVYLVRSDAGELRQVGSTCIKDFLGWNTLPAFLSDDDVEHEIEGYIGSGWRDYGTELVLGVAWALIKRDGFRPASFDNSTKGDVFTVLEPGKSERAQRFAREIKDSLPAAVAQAAQIRAYILSDEFKGDSEYVVNLKVALNANYVTARLFGLVCSAPQAWARSVERDLTRKAEKDAVCNEWIGHEGERRDFKVIVKSIRPIDSYYGVTYLYTLADDAGHVIKWFSSSKALGEDVTGEVVTIKATVKKLDTYNDVRQTVITRAKVLA